MTGLLHKLTGAYRESGFKAATYTLLFNATKRIKWHGLGQKMYNRQLTYQLNIIRNICSETLAKYREMPTDVKQANSDDGRKIYSIWLQGEDNCPPVVDACFKQMRKLYGDRLVVLDADAVNALDIDENVKNKYNAGLMSRNMYANIARMFLLRDGGMWCDATLFVEKIPETAFSSQYYAIRRPYVPTGKGAFNPAFVWNGKEYECRWSTFFWSLGKDSLLANFCYDMFCEFWRKRDEIFDYYIYDMIIRVGYEDVPAIRALIDSLQPNNNGSVHTLNHMLWKDYDEAVMRKFRDGCDLIVFKLAHKHFKDEALTNPNSFYNKVVAQ